MGGENRGKGGVKIERWSERQERGGKWGCRGAGGIQDQARCMVIVVEQGHGINMLLITGWVYGVME